jgi:hypothetical protein
LYTGGETGGLIAAGYGAVTATAWLYTASSENKKMADATKLCWQCIKKFERLREIKRIIEKNVSSGGQTCAVALQPVIMQPVRIAQ